MLSARYRLDAVIGDGGMGTVFRARHVPLLRDVALKVLKDEFAENPVTVKRFLREARAANLLRHENVVDIYDVCQEGATVFLVMELLRGESLAARLSRGTLSVDEAIEVMIPVTSALARAHALGVVHRDIKSDNIFLSVDPGRPRVRVLDFGVAYVRDEAPLTRTGQMIGTAEYMSPEQVMGRRALPASDLYALGTTLFELLSGRTPFEGAPTMVLMQQVQTPPPNLRDLCPDAPAEYVDLVMRLLDKEPTMRPASAHEVMDALRRMRSARTTGRSEAPTPDARREREQLLRTAVATAYSEASRPLWVGVTLDELTTQLAEVMALESRLHVLARDVPRAEQEARERREALVSEYEVADRELAALEVEEVEQKQALKPFEDAAASATETLAREWASVRAHMEGAWDPTEAAIAEMEQLGRDAATYRAARAAFESQRAALDAHTRRRAEAEARCDRVRESLAALDDTSRRATDAMREEADRLASQLAAHQAAFSSRAEALERHLASFPAATSLLPPEA